MNDKTLAGFSKTHNSVSSADDPLQFAYREGWADCCDSHNIQVAFDLETRDQAWKDSVTLNATEHAIPLTDTQTPSETNEEPSVMGGAFHPAPMPTSLDAIEAHVRQIQQICDASNLDPTQWLNDYAAQGETAPDLNVSECCPSWLSGKHQFIENSWTRCACGAQKANEQRELTLHDFGYAPGNYSIKCLDCGQEALWCDKRASRCETCAKQALAENRKGLSESEEGQS